MNFIDRWFEKRAQRRVDSSYNHGYDYAAGACMRGEKTPYELECEADISSAFGESGKECRAWDRGMMDAVDKLVLHGVVKDDRLGAQFDQLQNEEESSPPTLCQGACCDSNLRYLQTDLG